jgi:AraC-like DNA-binding protein
VIPHPRSDKPAKRAAPPRARDSRYRAAVIPTTILAELCRFADTRHVPVEPWFAGLGLTRAQIDDGTTRVSYRQSSTVIRRAQRELARDDLGLEIGKRQSLGTFGVLGLAMMTARTFGEAMALGIEHHAISGALMDMEMEVFCADEVALLARPRFADDPILLFLCEELFASCVVVCRSLLGDAFAPVRLELTYVAPPHADEYRCLFRCEVRFGAAYNRAVVDGRRLAKRLPTHHPVSAQQALAICREHSTSLKRQSEVVASVERILRRRLREQPRLTEVARSLNLTERTLRRHLAAVGRIYRDIHDRIRAERALELLHAGTLSVGDIGIEVGFSDPREFRRAFKRWTGVAPRTARSDTESS